MHIEFPLVVVEIPHRLPCVVYEVQSRKHLIDLFGDLNRTDYEETDGTIDLLDKLTEDNNTALYLSHKELYLFAFTDESKDIYTGHKDHEAIYAVKKFLYSQGRIAVEDLYKTVKDHI